MARNLPDEDPELKEAEEAAREAHRVYLRRRNVRTLAAAIAALKADFLAQTGTHYREDSEHARNPAALQPTDA